MAVNRFVSIVSEHWLRRFHRSASMAQARIWQCPGRYLRPGIAADYLARSEILTFDGACRRVFYGRLGEGTFVLADDKAR